KRRDLAGATDAYERACLAYRRDPWTWPVIAARELPLAREIASADSTGLLTHRLFAALDTPFAAEGSNLERQMVRVSVAGRLDGASPGTRTREALAPFGARNFPWDGELL